MEGKITGACTGLFIVFELGLICFAKVFAIGHGLRRFVFVVVEDQGFDVGG